MARPQGITDEAILRIIEELRLPHRSPSGVAVRDRLWTRFGIRASTQRVYRLLKLPPPPPRPIDPEDFSHQMAAMARARDAALERAALAEARECATQERTALHIDRLRQRLKQLGVDPYGFSDMSL